MRAKLATSEPRRRRSTTQAKRTLAAPDLFKAALPEWLRSRSSSNVLTRSQPSAAGDEEGLEEARAAGEEPMQPRPNPEAEGVPEDAERR